MFTVAEMKGKIGQYVQTLGIPAHDQDVPDVVEMNRAWWVCENGLVVASEVAGVHALWDRVAEAYERTGGWDGALGYPISDEHDVVHVSVQPPSTVLEGQSCEFQHGRIMQADAGLTAFAVFGLIWSAYEGRGLGFPVEDQRGVGNGWWAQTFGSVKGIGRTATLYAHDNGTTFELDDDRFAAHYLDLGGPGSWLGSPVGPAGPCSIVESPPNAPTSQCTASAYSFEFGQLAVDPQGRIIELPETIQKHDHWQPGAPIDVESWLTISARGDVEYRGHARDSGFPSYFYSFIWVVEHGMSDGTSITFQKHGHLGGTMDPDDRSEDWDTKKVDLTIRENWRTVRASPIQGVRGYDPQVGIIPLQLLAGLVTSPFWLVELFNEGAAKSSYGNCEPVSTTTTWPDGSQSRSISGCTGPGDSNGQFS